MKSTFWRRHGRQEHYKGSWDAQVQEDGSDDDSFLVMPVAEHGDLDSRLALLQRPA